MGRKGRPWTLAQFLGVHALAAHVHRLYVPGSRLLDDGWVMESLPLIRTAYQCALTAQWMAETEVAANAFFNEDLGQRRQAEETAQRGVAESVRGGYSIAGIDLRGLETSAAGPAGNFGQLCGDLIPGGDSAYFGYRVMSMYAHPSVALVDEYLATDESGQFSGLMLAPKDQSSGAWRCVLVATARLGRSRARLLRYGPPTPHPASHCRTRPGGRVGPTARPAGVEAARRTHSRHT